VVGDRLLAVEQGIVLETDAERARSIAREALGIYCGLPNYVNNWKRLGFTDVDVEERSDRLVDALIAWGDLDTLAGRVQAHRAAGADHVCVQVLGDGGLPVRRAAWQALAPALLG
jgi:probable F420-dependent oxidoreductase